MYIPNTLSVKNRLDGRKDYCTLVQVDHLEQGEANPIPAPDKTLASYYRLLTKKDVAEMMGCTERTVDRLVARNVIPFTQIPWGTGGKLKRRFIFGAIVKWMEQHNGGLMHQNAEDN